MQHLTQPYNSYQCGQTCIAMITNTTVQNVCDQLGKNDITHIKKNLQKHLDKNGFKTRLIIGKGITQEEIPNNSIVRLKFPNGNAHFVVKSQSKYYDPATGILESINAYSTITHYLTFEKA